MMHGNMKVKFSPLALKFIFSIYISDAALRCTWCRPAYICNKSNCASYP